MRNFLMCVGLALLGNWVVAQNIDDNLSGYFQSKELQGIFGDNNMMIEFRFDDVSKLSDSTYQIKGLSRAAMRLVHPLEGELTIDSLTKSAIYGHYTLVEQDKTEKYGEYKGRFTQYFKIEGDTPQPTVADYEGVWRSVRGSVLMCNWSSSMVDAEWCPEGFYDGEIVAEPYRKYGWESIGCDAKLWKRISPQFNLDWVVPIAHDAEKAFKIDERVRRRNRKYVGEIEYKVVDAYMSDNDDSGQKYYNYITDQTITLYFVVRNYIPGTVAPATLEREKGEDIRKRHIVMHPIVYKDGIGSTDVFIESKRLPIWKRWL